MTIDSQVNKAKKKVEDALSKVMRGTALDLFSAIDADTPVLEGRLRGNNRVGLGKVPKGVLDRKDKNGGLATGEAARILNRFKLLQDIYISNNLDYAVFVEQAQPFFEPNIKAFENQIEKNAKRQRIK